MLTYEDLAASFPGVSDIGSGVLKCRDKLPKVIYHYYVRTGGRSEDNQDFLAVSENLEDDVFASSILSALPKVQVGPELMLCDIPENGYGFSNLLLAPSEFHAYFKGRLDDKRKNLIFCLPIHKSEFSGNESVDEFYLMRRSLIPSLNWKRDVCPKISLRFDNPKTRGGTGGGYVLVKYDTILKEIDNLRGVDKGFIEIINYKDLILEILSKGGDSFYLIIDRDDSRREVFEKNKLLEILWRFLTE